MVRVLICNITGITQTEYDTLYAIASPTRRQRADRYPRREDAIRCLAAEALLRYAFPDRSPEDLLREPGGKPYWPGIHFNLSHSGPWVALAVGGGPVGIDVECFRKNRDTEKLAKRYFTEAEWTYAEDSQTRFLEIWTAKEAVLKRSGDGLRKSPGSFCILDRQDIRTWSLPDAVLTVCADDFPAQPERLSVHRLLESLPHF